MDMQNKINRMLGKSKTKRKSDYPFDQPLSPASGKKVWMGNMLFDSAEKAEKYRKEEGLLRGRIVAHKPYGQHILIQDKFGNKFSTKNIAPIGCRTIYDGEEIHGKNAKSDIIIDYEL